MIVSIAALGVAIAVAAWPQAQAADETSLTSTGSPTGSRTAGSQPCDWQTWPYLDASCLKGGAGHARHVRIVSTDHNVPRTMTSMTASHLGEAKVTGASSRPPSNSAAQAGTKPRGRAGRRLVTEHYARKRASGHSPHERGSAPYGIAPGHESAFAARQWRGIPGSVMAYGDDDTRALDVPHESDFGRSPFFQR
jgi:hypothetical protein